MTPQKKRHYSIRKLRAGVGSILIGTTLLFGLSTQLVQANVTTDGTTSDSAGGTAATPGVTASETPATTAAGGETATQATPNTNGESTTGEEKPKESTPTTEAAPKSQTESKEAAPEKAAPQAEDTKTAGQQMIDELERILDEVNKLEPLDPKIPAFKEQYRLWNGDEKDPGLERIAKARLEKAKSKGYSSEKELLSDLYDFTQFATIEKIARQAQVFYQKHDDPELRQLIEKTFSFSGDSSYASLEGPTHLGVYVKNDLIPKFEKIEKLAKELEEKAKKEKEKEQPTPAPIPEEPKKDEQPAPEKPEDKDKPTPEKPEKQPEDTDKPEEAPKKPEDTEKPADPKEPEVPKKDETPAPTPEPKKEEEKPAPEPKKDTEKPADPKEPEVPKKDETPAPEPKKDTEKPAPSQPKQDDSMKKDYKLFYQTKDKTEEVDFKGTPEELKATLDKAIEKYKQNGYPYVDRFERENRILLVFNQHKSIIVLETNGDGGSRQSRPFYGTPQELEAEIKKLTESLSDTYKIEKKEGYDKLDPTVKTITLVLTKLSDTPKETPAPKKEDKP
ncbi:GAG-binding domain-containing protein, partial [Streptococcus ruminantium]|uniref:GAG-binding domain-containing protein n=1 Tax=Streptococcus ruminantium TaxID=1917441 RepID=UPI001D15320B